MAEGVVYVVYGEAARREAVASIASLRRYHRALPVVVVGEAVTGADEHLPFVAEPGEGEIPTSRWAKLNLDSLSPFDYTLYLDADTRIRGDLRPGFGLLVDGWDMVIAPSGRQGGDVMGHLPAEDRAYTLDVLGNPLPLQWQAGLFYFARERVGATFAAWRAEWTRFRGQDQGALLRALMLVPLRVWALGGVWNAREGEVVAHLFGRAR